jgi:hypothetical protein
MIKASDDGVGVGEVGDDGGTIDGDNVGEQRGTTNGSRQQ